MKISVIIPVLNEERTINRTIESLYKYQSHKDFEVIVSDGHPLGTTINVITDKRVKVIKSEKGRGIQMNKGASIASGEILLFLHSDTLLPCDSLKDTVKTLEDKKNVLGAFDMQLDEDSFIFRIIEKTASLRSRFTNTPFGDQCLFLRKEMFNDIGGYKNFPIMEDVDLVRRIKHKGRVKILKSKAVTSARRWKKEGILFCTLRNWLILLLFFAGVSPFRLKRFYNGN